MKHAGIIAILWWIAWISFHYFTVIAYGLNPFAAITDTLVSNLLLIFLCTGAGFTIRFYRPDLTKTAYVLAGTLLLAFLYTWLFSQLMQEFIEDDFYLNFLKSSQIPRGVIAFFMISISITIGWIIYYNNEYHEEKSRLLETNRLVKDAELTNLVQKIQPHFLFNTLNSVNALIQTDPVAARKMIQELSGFLRGSLNSNNDKNTNLAAEIDQLKLYLEIEKVRFGQRLITEFDIATEASAFTIPPLLLQPLVENAIKFGLYDTLGPVTIEIKAQLEDRNLVIAVSNPYDQQNSNNQTGTGFGLSALKKRLDLHFNRNDLLQLTRENGIFTATLKIPQT